MLHDTGITPELPPLEGVRLNALSAGIKKNNALDLVLVELPATAKTAGVFTQNAYCAAPVVLCKQHLNLTKNTRYLLINSGNANACSGQAGYDAAQQLCAQLAQQQGVATEQILPFSTGVIGEPLPAGLIRQALPTIAQGLTAYHWPLAMQGIMTTDTCPKGTSRQVHYGDVTITVNGIAKGSGMIKPNMATMLAYVVTDVAISDALLQPLLQEVADLSFNRITIDGDTSTNDSCLLIATGGVADEIDCVDHPLYLSVKQAIIDVFQQLAQAIVHDGEGGTKFVTLSVEEGATTDECLQVAYAIAHSPLVKTALFASDPNWGRIVAAIGNAGIHQLDVNPIRVYLDDVLIVEQGGRASTYSETDGQRVMNQSDILLRVCLGRGGQKEVLWTTDLSHEYVKINAEYRT